MYSGRGDANVVTSMRALVGCGAPHPLQFPA
jgi:hypothetical protein